MAIINVGAYDALLTLNTPLPAAGTAVTTGILDLEAFAPNSNAWRMGRFQILFPNLPENNAGAGITVSMQCANSSLTSGAIAPQMPPPGVFATPVTSQTTTIASVAVTGSAQQAAWMTLAFDATGSSFQFYQFVITTPGGVASQGENISIRWVKDSE